MPSRGPRVFRPGRLFLSTVRSRARSGDETVRRYHTSWTNGSLSRLGCRSWDDAFLPAAVAPKSTTMSASWRKGAHLPVCMLTDE